MNSQILAARMRQIKNSEEEMSNMCKAMEEYAAEVLAEERKNNAIKMLKDKLSLDQITQYTSLTVEQVTAIGKQAALL